MQLRYMGFTQQGGLRSYFYQRSAHSDFGVRTKHVDEFHVDADLALLALFQVRVQELPALCLSILTSALAASPTEQQLCTAYAITKKDLDAHILAHRPAAGHKPPRRRKPPRPVDASQLRWPRRS
jgi:hypothetical protein